MNDLRTLGGTISGAFNINNSGQIVGYSTLAGDTVKHAFLDINGTMLDLNNQLDGSGSGWSLKYARSINNEGWIVGDGISPGGKIEPFLLIPVPEPSGLFLLPLGVLPLFRWLRMIRR